VLLQRAVTISELEFIDFALAEQDYFVLTFALPPSIIFNLQDKEKCFPLTFVANAKLNSGFSFFSLSFFAKQGVCRQVDVIKVLFLTCLRSPTKY